MTTHFVCATILAIILTLAGVLRCQTAVARFDRPSNYQLYGAYERYLYKKADFPLLHAVNPSGLPEEWHAQAISEAAKALDQWMDVPTVYARIVHGHSAQAELAAGAKQITIQWVDLGPYIGGMATVGDQNGGQVWINTRYFNGFTAWSKHVMLHEYGHTLGFGHYHGAHSVMSYRYSQLDYLTIFDRRLMCANYSESPVQCYMNAMPPILLLEPNGMTHNPNPLFRWMVSEKWHASFRRLIIRDVARDVIVYSKTYKRSTVPVVEHLGAFAPGTYEWSVEIIREDGWRDDSWPTESMRFTIQDGESSGSAPRITHPRGTAASSPVTVRWLPGTAVGGYVVLLNEVLSKSGSRKRLVLKGRYSTDHDYLDIQLDPSARDYAISVSSKDAQGRVDATSSMVYFSFVPPKSKPEQKPIPPLPVEPPDPPASDKPPADDATGQPELPPTENVFEPAWQIPIEHRRVPSNPWVTVRAAIPRGFTSPTFHYRSVGERGFRIKIMTHVGPGAEWHGSDVPTPEIHPNGAAYFVRAQDPSNRIYQTTLRAISP